MIKEFSINYIKLNKNYGISLARNIGTKFARGSIVIFLDDDAIPEKDFVEQHITAYQDNKIIGLRGKCKPRNPNNIYNYLASHYDLGDEILPWYINLEGNSSFRRDVLIEIEGFNTKFEGAGGHEGLELSYRIIKEYKDKGRLIYYPKAIIYHDYVDNFKQYFSKQARHKINKRKKDNQLINIFTIAEEYGTDISPKINSDNILIKIMIKMIKLSTSLMLNPYFAINKKTYNIIK